MGSPILGEDLAIDVARLTVTRLLVQANSGGGKSYALRRLLEQTFGLIQHIVLDPEGEFYSLREQFPYYLVGEDGEAPADIETAGQLALRVLELGVSVIIDLSDLGPNKAIYVARFLDALVGAPRELWHPTLVVVDEAHRFCPERGKAKKSEESEAIESSTAAVIRLMDAGRKRPFCGVLATQRIAKLSKDAAYECNNVMIGRSLGADAKRAGEEIDLTPREAKQQLRKLAAGQFYVFGPAFTDEVRLVQVGKVVTTHPEPGQAPPPVPPTPEKVREVLGSLKDLPTTTAEPRTDVQLRARVRELETTVAEKERLLRESLAQERVEVPVIALADVARIENALDRAREMLDEATVTIETLGSVIVDLKAAIELNGQFEVRRTRQSENDSPQTGRSENSGGAKARAGGLAGSERRSQGVTTGETAPSGNAWTQSVKQATATDRQNVLDAIAQLGACNIGLSVLSLAAWLNVHPKTKTLLATIGALRADDMLEGLALTAKGRISANPPHTITKDAQRTVLVAPLAESQVRILDMISTFDHIGRSTTHVALAAWLGVHPKTKTLLEDLGKLRSRGFLTDDNALTEIGKLASKPNFAGMKKRDLIAPLTESQQRVMIDVLGCGVVATMTELATHVQLHPKTKTLLEDIGILRSRGFVTKDWPMRPTDVFGGAS